MIDYEILVWLNSWVGQWGWFDWLINFLAHDLGYLLALFFIGAVFYMESSWHKRIVFLGQGFLAAFISRGLLVPLIRIFIHRVRPFVAHPDIQHIIIQDPNEYSFPSGHTAIFFALAFILYRYYPKLGVPLGITAVLIASARVIGGVHYPADILGGVLVAWIAAVIALRVTKNFTQVSRR